MLEQPLSTSAFHNSTYKEYKADYIDPLRHREPVPSSFRSSDFRSSNNQYENLPYDSSIRNRLSNTTGSYGDGPSNNIYEDLDYKSNKPYNPSNTYGSYNDSQYDTIPYQTSNGGKYDDRSRPKVTIREPTPQYENIGNSKNGLIKGRKNVRTFQCYNDPMGPDIDYIANTGPEYRPQRFSPAPSKPEVRKYDWSRSSVDPVTNWTEYKGQNVGLYNGYNDYKLTEDNNLGLRHWDSNFVDDTVYAQQTDRHRSRDRNQNPTRSESGPVTETYSAPVFAAAPPVKKKSKAQTTQTQKVKTKTFATQFDPVKTKTTAVQTKPETIPTSNTVNSRNIDNSSKFTILQSKNEKNAPSNTVKNAKVKNTSEAHSFKSKNEENALSNKVNSAKVKNASKVDTCNKSKSEKNSKSNTSRSKTLRTKAKSVQTHLTYGLPAKDDKQSVKNNPKKIPDVSVYMRYQGQPMYVSAEELAQNRTEKAQYANKMIHNAASTVRRYKALASMPTEISGLKVVKETPELKSIKQIPGLQICQLNSDPRSKSVLSIMPQTYHHNPALENKNMPSLQNRLSGLKLAHNTLEPQLVTQGPGLQIYQSNPNPRANSVLSFIPKTYRY